MAVLLWLFAGPLAAAEDSPCPATALCRVPLGSYGLVLPETRPDAGLLPAVLFFHGWGSSAGKVLGNAKIRDVVLGRGYALVVPQGLRGPEGGNRGWSHQGSPHQNRDEMAFVREVMEDAVRRAPVDRRRVLVAGFSQGGSMVWHLACFDGRAFRGFAPIAGAFWEPIPQSCPGGPVNLLHLQGFRDNVVPIEGRKIGERWHQADLFAGLALLRRTNGLRSNPDHITIEDRYRCRMWTGNPAGRLGLCLHDGGHMLPDDWLERAIDWFEALPQG